MSDLREALVWGGERAGDGEEAHKIAAILSVNNGDRLEPEECRKLSMWLCCSAQASDRSTSRKSSGPSDSPDLAQQAADFAAACAEVGAMEVW